MKELPYHKVETTDKSFADLGLSPEILKELSEVGFEHPTPIQAAVIPTALEGQDIVGCAQTGTGKTAAFVLPLADKLYHGRGLRGLILSPTREIAMQTKQFLDFFGSEHKLKTAILIGGVKYPPQIQALKAKPDIVVATPGRLIDHIERKNLSLHEVQELVLDEADRMLDMGFYPQISEVLKLVPKKRHTMMFSATMPVSIERLAHQFMSEPIKIAVAPPGTGAAGIEHRLYLVEEKDRERLLLELVKAEQGTLLVFAQTKRDVDALTRLLVEHGEPAETVHSDRTQKERSQALEGFRQGEHSILVATDVLARGIDVTGISQIISYQVPPSADDYVHRSGRTGRAGATGISSVIGTWRDRTAITAIERLLGQPLKRCHVAGIPEYKERKAKKRSRLRGY